MATHIRRARRQAGLCADRQPARDLCADPVNAYVATRLGSPAINLMPRSGVSADVVAPPETAAIGVRTEHCAHLRAPTVNAVGRVRWIEHLGDQNHLHVMIARNGEW